MSRKMFGSCSLAVAAVVLLLNSASAQNIATQEVAEKLAPPFDLTSQQLAAVEEVLYRWEQASKQAKTLKCDMRIWQYNSVQGGKTEAHGMLRYEAPLRWEYQVLYQREGAKWTPAIQGNHWLCDGQDCYFWNHQSKHLETHTLTEAMRKQLLVNGPSPVDISFHSQGRHYYQFVKRSSSGIRIPLLLTSVENFQHQYYARVAEQKSTRQEIRLELYPKYDVTNSINWRKAELILDRQSSLPKGMKIYHTHSRSWNTYAFSKMKVNPVNLWGTDGCKPGEIPLDYEYKSVLPAVEVVNLPGPPATK